MVKIQNQIVKISNILTLNRKLQSGKFSKSNLIQILNIHINININNNSKIKRARYIHTFKKIGNYLDVKLLYHLI